MTHANFNSDQRPDSYHCNATNDTTDLAYSWSYHDMSIIGSMGGLNLLGEHETHMSYGEVGLAQPQMQSEYRSPYLLDVYHWSPSSTQSTPSQLCTPSDRFDDLQPGIYHHEVDDVYMGPPDSFTLKDTTQPTFPSQGNIIINKVKVASGVIDIFSEASVPDESSIGPRSCEVLFTLAIYINHQTPEIQSWLMDSAKTKIGTDANCHAASKRKCKAANRLYPCYWCLRPFTTKNNLGNHVRAHMTLKISRCPCGYESTNVTIPSRHRVKCNAIPQGERLR
ncbi:hypothetical protein BJ165DRAFT_1022311 [Panaeolus papilionaceus]|nr:hypothetical protein BJ165DRAFT_1022311 [Panaeolus papilionaceus]